MGTDKKTFGTGTEFSAVRTDLACVEWTDFDNIDSFSFSFVFDEVLQLKETPAIQPEVESLSFSHLSYPFKVFQYNSSGIATIDNLFAYVMVYPSLEPLLSARNLFKKLSGATSAFGLKFGSQSFEFEPVSLDLFSAEELPIARYSNMVYADINAKNSILDIRFGIDIFGKCEQEETSAFFVYSQKAFNYIPSEIFFVAVRNCEWYLDSAFDSCQAQDIVLKRGTAREVIPHGTSVYNRLGFSFLDHTASLLYAGDRKLTLQTNASEMFVDKWMQFDIIPDFVLPCSIDAELQSLAINPESFSYLWSCRNLDFGCCSDVHKGIEAQQVYIPYASDCPVINGGWQFLPTINCWVSCLRFYDTK